MQKGKGKKRGKLTVFTGPMFADKTTGLIVRAQKPDEESLVFKPGMDNRKEGSVLHAHNGKTHEARLFNAKNPQEILKIVKEYPNSAVVLIDEIQFCSEGIVEVLEALLVQELDVIVAGLDLDYRKEPFGSMSEIIEMAQDVFHLTARCNGENCEQDAIYSYAKMPLDQIENVGADEIFGAACEDCFDDLRGDL